jgi:hydroxyacylglutathione hydrolase
MQCPMEDNFADVVAKAQRGLRFSDAELSRRAGISREQLARVKAEVYDAEVLQKLAPVLRLDAGALVGLPQYKPAPVEVPGLAVFTTRYGGMKVNAYVVTDVARGLAAAFDTGADATPMIDFLRERKLRLTGVFVTHAHGDHMGDLERLCEATGAPAWISKQEFLGGGTHVFEPGQRFECGDLWIETRLTRGHTAGGTSYVVRGLERPVVVVGDALFAGSMGGAMESYPDALRTDRESIFSLPPETVICPGHGPLTTVAEERVHNPFFA